MIFVSTDTSLNATAYSIITDALKEIGVLAEGDTPSSAMANDALRALNRIMALLSNYGEFAYAPSSITMPLTGQSSFTVGPSGQAVFDRPLRIDTAWTDLNGISFPCEVVDNQKFDAISFKGALSSYPSCLWYESLLPNGVVHVWPASTGGTLTCRVLDLVNSFSNLTQSLVMPLGYEELLVKKLAVSIAPQYPAGVLSPLTVKAATEAWNAISTTNRLIPTLKLDETNPSSSIAAFIGGY